MAEEPQVRAFLCPMCDLPVKRFTRETIEVMPKEPCPQWREYAPGDVTFEPCGCVKRREIG
jgi:hypothetical protein